MIFVNFIQIIWDISNTKTIKYENIVIFLDKATQCEPG